MEKNKIIYSEILCVFAFSLMPACSCRLCLCQMEGEEDAGEGPPEYGAGAAAGLHALVFRGWDRPCLKGVRRGENSPV